MNKRIGMAAIGIGVGIGVLTGCSSQKNGLDSSPSQDTTSFPPFVSTCDHGNRLYVIWLPAEQDQVTSVRDPSCPLS